MRREYDLRSDTLETIFATTPVTKNHSALLTALAARTEYRGARYVMTQDMFSNQPARVIDAEGHEIAPDYRVWVNDQLAKHGGSVRGVWLAHKDAGYWLTEIRPVLHYFVHDRGGDQDNFVQFAVWEEQEFAERQLFPREASWGLPSAEELRLHAPDFGDVARFERRSRGEPRYQLDKAIDMHRFAEAAETEFIDFYRRRGDCRLIETNSSTGEQRVVTVRELTPGYDRIQWRGRRFFDDWTTSSAGRAGERACTRWTFNTSDYTDPQGVRHLNFVPQWAHTRKIAPLKNTHKLDVYSLYGKLTQLDERIGMSFAWYFYGLHGNLVRDAHMERVLEAAEAGLIVLPEHDYQVLRRWSNDPYGF